MYLWSLLFSCSIKLYHTLGIIENEKGGKVNGRYFECYYTTCIIFLSTLIFTALGGVFSERSGVVNIGLEGLMVMGAFIAIVFNLTFASALGAWTPWIAMLVATIISGVFSLIHALATVSFRADHVVSG